MRHTTTLEYVLLAAGAALGIAVFIAPTMAEIGATLAHVAALLPH